MGVSVSTRITDILRQFGYPVCQGLYEGKADTYFYWVMADDRGYDFGDDCPEEDVVSLQIHFVCPWTVSYTEIKKRIRAALLDADCTYPRVVDLSDEEGRIRHLVFECEAEDTDVYE